MQCSVFWSVRRELRGTTEAQYIEPLTQQSLNGFLVRSSAASWCDDEKKWRSWVFQSIKHLLWYFFFTVLGFCSKLDSSTELPTRPVVKSPLCEDQQQGKLMQVEIDWHAVIERHFLALLSVNTHIIFFWDMDMDTGYTIINGGSSAVQHTSQANKNVPNYIAIFLIFLLLTCFLDSWS